MTNAKPQRRTIVKALADLLFVLRDADFGANPGRRENLFRVAEKSEAVLVRERNAEEAKIRKEWES